LSTFILGLEWTHSTQIPLGRFLSLYLALRELDMRTACFPRGRILLLILFIGSHLPLIGCNDESRTSGTMVQVSEEVKAHQKAKAESYKGGPPKSKAKAAVPKK
jgi:hypothetical protein